ncbi:MAG: two-component regulator propeller domain-containing protein [Calditrichaceae bacterium]
MIEIISTRKIFFLLFLFLLSSNSIYSIPLSTNAKTGGQVKFENLSIADGLSQVTVYSILQDHRGFMWFGTRDGLNKYDGYNFTVYRHQPYDSTSLIHNKINSLHEDHNGVIWIGTDNGLTIYNRDLDCFQLVLNDSLNLSDICNKIVNKIYEDRNGNIWIGTEDGLCEINQDRNKIQSYKSDKTDQETLSDNNISVIFEDNQGSLWIGTNDGLNYMVPDSDKFLRFRHQNNNPNTICDNRIYDIYEDESSNLWIATANGLSKYDLKKNKFRTYKHNRYNKNSLSNNTINVVIQDKKGLFWLGTEFGLSILDKRSGDFTNFYYDKIDQFSISDNHIYSLYEDRSGIIWIGTYGGGICKYNPQLERFNHYLINQKKDSNRRDNFTYAFDQKQKGILWIGTNQGLYRYNRKKGTYKRFYHSSSDSNKLSDDRIRALHFDSRGFLWIGTYSGLNRFDTRTNTFQVFKHNPHNNNSLSNDFITVIEEYPSGILWLGTNGGGLNRFDIHKNKFTRYTADSISTYPLSSNRIFEIHADSNGIIWLGTYGGGLDRLDPKSGEVKIYKYQRDNIKSISGNYIYSIHEESDSILWIGTYGAGLNRLNTLTESFSNYDQIASLKNNLIYGILEDNRQRLWMSTNRGLIRFNPNIEDESKNIRQFGIKDGLQSTEFNFGAYYQNEQGEMIFGGVNGFNIFHPDSITDHQYKAPIVLIGLEIEHKRIKVGTENGLSKALSELQQIELKPGKNSITFEFSALDYSNPEKNQYAYKLIGIDDDWIYVPSSKRFAQYTNLPAGKYVLKVKGTNSDGIWNEDGTSIKVIVKPEYWETLWFKILSGIILIGIGIFFYNMRMNNIRRRNAQLQEMNFALGKEIEERLKVEEALQYSEEKYRTITDNLHAGIYRNTPRAPGNFIEVNPTFINMFGFNSKEEALETGAADLYHDPKDRNRFKRKMRRKGFVDNEIYLLKRKDGSTFWASITAVAVADDKGDVIYFDGMIEDISERKRVEQALIESEEKYRILVERANDGILIVQDDIITYSNPRMTMLSGYDTDELLESSFKSYVALSSYL